MDFLCEREIAHKDERRIEVALGPSGVGETHLSARIGRAVITAGYTVLFTTASTLIAQLVQAHAEGRLE